MSHIINAANSGLLAYGITTNPDPIQASPAQGNPSFTSIVITVSNNTGNNIYCNTLTFSFPIGTLAQDLTDVSKGILVSTNPSSKWQISMTSAGVFTATPIAAVDNLISSDGLSFQIYNIQANCQVGTFTLGAVENSSTDNKTFTDKNNSFDLAKFPYGFYVNNFAASAPMVQDNSTVMLTWNGSDLATYTILYNDKTFKFSGSMRSWTSPNLTATTTFALKASVQEQGETVDTYQYVTVIVANPELIATTLKVLETSTLTGKTSIGARLDVTGDTSVNNFTSNGAFDAKGPATVKGPLGVTEKTTLGQVETGEFKAPLADITSLNTDKVKVKTSFDGTNSVVSMFSGVQPIPNTGTYTAHTDGLVIAQIRGPSEVVSVSFCAVTGSSNGISLTAHGGNFLGYSGWNNYYWNLNESFTLPVKKGSQWSIGLYNAPGNDHNGSASFWWVPLGSTSEAASFERLSDDQPEFKAPFPANVRLADELLQRGSLEAAPPNSNTQASTSKYNIADFIEFLSYAFKLPITEEEQKNLAEKLQKLIKQ